MRKKPSVVPKMTLQLPEEQVFSMATPRDNPEVEAQKHFIGSPTATSILSAFMGGFDDDDDALPLDCDWSLGVPAVTECGGAPPLDFDDNDVAALPRLHALRQKQEDGEEDIQDEVTKESGGESVSSAGSTRLGDNSASEGEDEEEGNASPDSAAHHASAAVFSLASQRVVPGDGVQDDDESEYETDSEEDYDEDFEDESEYETDSECEEGEAIVAGVVDQAEAITTSRRARSSSRGAVRREGSAGAVRREASRSGVRRESSRGAVRREGSTGAVRREGSSSGTRRESSRGAVRREGSTAGSRREGSRGAVRRDPSSGAVRRRRGLDGASSLFGMPPRPQNGKAGEHLRDLFAMPPALPTRPKVAGGYPIA
jgi:hypothetical protein